MEALCRLLCVEGIRRCPVWCPVWLQFRMRFHIIQRAPRHLFLSAIGKHLGRFFQPDPAGSRHLNSHGGGDGGGAAGAATPQIETDELENARASAPRTWLDAPPF